ncbi:uncharacterized protein [Dendrobates tinctorius]|uniref:uncharacterized protein n=1 Tax=Dendrobates tinctorius TaxID=92724 RepID=UPI003CC92651
MYEDVMMDEQPRTSPDGSRRRNPPERSPRPQCTPDRAEEDHQGEDLTIIKVEVKEEADEVMIDPPSMNEGKEGIPDEVSAETPSGNSQGILVLSQNYKVEDDDIMQPSSGESLHVNPGLHSPENSSNNGEPSSAQSRIARSLTGKKPYTCSKCGRVTMPLTPAEKMKRRREKLKETGAYEQYKIKLREAVKKSREKKKIDVGAMSQKKQEKIKEEERKKVRARVRKCRERKKSETDSK